MNDYIDMDVSLPPFRQGSRVIIIERVCWVTAQLCEQWNLEKAAAMIWIKHTHTGEGVLMQNANTHGMTTTTTANLSTLGDTFLYHSDL